MKSKQITVPGALQAGAMSVCLALAGLVAASSASHAQSPCGPTTTVQAGDTMFSIAQRCDTSVEALQQANPDVDPHTMPVGMTLHVAGEAGELRPVEPDATATPGQYTVQPGDTPATIATALGVTIQALLEANPELDPRNLPVGHPIVLPPDGAPPSEEPDDRRTVAGVMTEEGVECPAMRGQDGQLYTLIGDLEGFGTGDFVEVRGVEPEVDFCQQGITIEIEDIRGVG